MNTNCLRVQLSEIQFSFRLEKFSSSYSFHHWTWLLWSEIETDFSEMSSLTKLFHEDIIFNSKKMALTNLRILSSK